MSRKRIWDGLDALEGKEVGSSHAALNKERVRQGYDKGSKSKAIKLKKGRGREGSMEHKATGLHNTHKLLD